MDKLIITFADSGKESFPHKDITKSLAVVKKRNQRNMIEARISIKNKKDLLFDFAKQKFVIEGTKNAWTKQSFTINGEVSPVNNSK